MIPSWSEVDWVATAQVVTAVAAVAAVIATILAALISKRRSKGKVEIVDVTISDRETVFAKVIIKLPVIDVKVKNVGDRSVVLTKAEFEVCQVWGLYLQFAKGFYLDVSGQYNVVIDPNQKPPYKLTIPVSHVVKPDEADRLSFSFTLEPMVQFESVYHLVFRLVFDDNRVSESKHFILVLPDLSDTWTPYFIEDYNKYWGSQNQRKWHSEDLKRAHDSMRNDDRARTIDQHNRALLLEASAVGEEFSRRTIQLIQMAKQNQ